MDLPPGFALAAVLEREDPRDAFVSTALRLARRRCRRARVVGTSSLRRVVQLRALRPDLRIEPLRGNLDTRLRKLDEGEYDAIVLAAAGLMRLGLAERIRARFDAATDAARAPARARSASRSRADAAALARAAGDARRTRRPGWRCRPSARCRAPSAAAAACRWPRMPRWRGDALELRRRARPSRAARRAAAARATAPARPSTRAAAEALGRAVAAARCSTQGAGAYLAAATSAPRRPTVSAARLPRLLVTRPAAQAEPWVERLRARGIDAVALPLIEIAPPRRSGGAATALGRRWRRRAPGRVRQRRTRSLQLLRRAAGRRRLAGRRSRPARRARARARRCATPACRRRRSSRRRPTRRSSIPKRSGSSLQRARLARRAACSSCAATAAATGWPSDSRERRRAGRLGGGLPARSRRVSTRGAARIARRRVRRAGDARLAVQQLARRSAISSALAGAGPLVAARARWRPIRASPRGRAGSASARVVEAPPGARRGGRLHTIDRNRERRSLARRRAREPPSPLPRRRLPPPRGAAAPARCGWPVVAAAGAACSRRRARASPGAPTSACAAVEQELVQAPAGQRRPGHRGALLAAPGAGRDARCRRQGRAARGARRRGRAAARPARGAGAVGGALARREPAGRHRGGDARRPCSRPRSPAAPSRWWRR